MNWELVLVFGFFVIFVSYLIWGVILTARKQRALNRELKSEVEALKELEKSIDWLDKWLKDFDLVSNNKNMPYVQKQDTLRCMLTEMYEHCKNPNHKEE